VCDCITIFYYKVCVCLVSSLQMLTALNSVTDLFVLRDRI